MRATLGEIDVEEAWLEFHAIWLSMYGFEPHKRDVMAIDRLEWFCKGKDTKDKTIKNLVAALRLAITWLELCEHDPRLSSTERGILVTDLVEVRKALNQASK